jgi:L-alanine-DL-glutamate epimerase-like enolase superfamily enzyme
LPGTGTSKILRRLVDAGGDVVAVGGAELVHKAAPVIIGENPHNIGKLYDLMIRCLSGEGSLAGATVTAISGIEIALWDLVGRALNTPIYNLFGGRYRDAMTVDGPVGAHTGWVMDFADLKAHAEGLGFAHVESGALVRSSYHAGEMHKAAVRKQRGELPAWATADA